MGNTPQPNGHQPPSTQESALKPSVPKTDQRRTASESIKAVAIYEMVKGFGALAGAGGLWWWHQDIEHWLTVAASAWHQRFGEWLAPQFDSVIRVAQQANDHWHLFLLLVMAYASLRFFEAYGLWQDKTWAYWFGVLGYGVFIPIEVYYLITQPFDWFQLAILLSNIVIVIVVYRNMKRKGLV